MLFARVVPLEYSEKTITAGSEGLPYLLAYKLRNFGQLFDLYAGNKIC